MKHRFLLMALAVCFAPFTIHAQEVEDVQTTNDNLGDVNFDGAFTVTDVTEMVNYILQIQTVDFNLSAADVNGDGGINVTDVTMLVNKILGKDQGTIDDGNVIPRPLVFEVSQNDFDSPNKAPARERMQRSPELTMDNFDNFFINWAFGRQSGSQTTSVTYRNGHWESENAQWPSNAYDDDNVDFYAYNTGDFQNNLQGGDDYPCITVEVDQFADRQTDLLVAKNSDCYDNCDGHVFLGFAHACAAVQLKICKTQKLKDYDVTVNSVTLCNIKSKGRYHFKTETWSDLGVDSYFTMTAYNPEGTGGLLIDTEAKWLAQEGEYLFLIPQSLTAWDKNDAELKNTYIKINCTISKGDFTFSGDAYIPFGANLEKGKIHSFVINMGTAMRKIVNGNLVQIIQ